MHSKAPVPWLTGWPMTMLTLGFIIGSFLLWRAAFTMNTEVESNLIWRKVELMSAIPIWLIGLYSASYVMKSAINNKCRGSTDMPYTANNSGSYVGMIDHAGIFHANAHIPPSPGGCKGIHWGGYPTPPHGGRDDLIFSTIHEKCSLKLRQDGNSRWMLQNRATELCRASWKTFFTYSFICRILYTDSQIHENNFWSNYLILLFRFSCGHKMSLK